MEPINRAKFYLPLCAKWMHGEVIEHIHVVQLETLQHQEKVIIYIYTTHIFQLGNFDMAIKQTIPICQFKDSKPNRQ